MAYSIDESRTARRFTPGPEAGRQAPTEIDIHHWGIDGQSHDGVVNFFCNTAETSAHFVVSAGRIHCLVSTTDVAWHAGNWAVNLRSIGIECRPEATDADYAAVAWLIRHLRSMYGDLPLRPHKLYASTDCPGRYDLARLDRLARTQTPAPPTQQKDWFDMATKAELKEVVHGEMWAYQNPKTGPDAWRVLNTVFAQTTKTMADAAATRALVEQIAKGQNVTIDYGKIDAAVDSAVKTALAESIKISGEITVGAAQ